MKSVNIWIHLLSGLLDYRYRHRNDQIKKTDVSKMSHWLFGGKVLMDKNSGQFFVRSIFNPTNHFVCLCLDILAVRMAFVRKGCGGKFGWSVLVDSLPKLIFGTSRYVKYSRVPSQLTCCARRSTSRGNLLSEYHTVTTPSCPWQGQRHATDW